MAKSKIDTPSVVVPLTVVDGIKVGDERQSLMNPAPTGKVKVVSFEATKETKSGYYVGLEGAAGPFRVTLDFFKQGFK